MNGISNSVPSSGSTIGERLFAVVWLGVCLLITWQMWELKVPISYEPLGPKAFPLLLSALMALCCGVLLINPDPNNSFPDAKTLLKGMMLFATLLAYGAFFEVLGFPVGTMLMVFLVARIFGGSMVSSALAGLLLAGFGYLLFDRLLGVSIPIGRLWN